MLGFFCFQCAMKRSVLIFLALSALSAIAMSQENYADYEVEKVAVSGNTTLKTEELLAVIQTKETPLWLWKFLYKISESVGKKPEYFDRYTVDNDVVRLKQYYWTNGFYRSHIDTVMTVDHDSKTIGLEFNIQEGRRSYVDTLRYVGLVDIPGDLRNEILNNTLLNVGDPYVEKKLEDERSRVINAFANYGYVQVQVDTSLPLHYASTNNISILLSFSSGQRYKFGSIQVRHDTTVQERIETAVVLRHIDFRPGDFYSQSAKVESERNLNRLGVFESAKIEEIVTDSTSRTLAVPIDIFVRPRSFYELSPEIGVNDERGYSNISMGLGYIDRNFFGGARNLTSRVRLNFHSLKDLDLIHAFSLEGLRDSTILTNADVSVNFIQPYFINNRTSLSTTLFAALEKQRTYYSPIIRLRIGATAQTATYARVFVDWNLEAIDPQSTVTGKSIELGTKKEITAQFNSIVAFTLQRDKRNDFFYPSSGYFHSASLEEAGLLPSVFNGLFGSGLPYAKYVKASAVGQWYWDPGQMRSLIWAAKLHVGAARLYGNSPTDVPLTRRFYAGGSLSIRGWRARDLGAVAQPDSGGSALLEASLEARWNLLKGASDLWFFETRKLSIVFFYDAGNVWAQPEKVSVREIAMAAGLGLRYDTVAGPIRVDFGWKVYDPRATADNQWITQRPFFSETLGNFVFHFGIGHSF
jgi:outer membrane protein insertion porin family